MFAYIFDNDDVYLDWIDIFLSVILFSFGLWFFYGMYSKQYDMGQHLNEVYITYFIDKSVFKLSYNVLMKNFVLFFSFFKKDLLYYSLPFLMSLCLTLKFLFYRIACIDYLSRHNKLFAHKYIVSFFILLLCFIGQLSFIPQIADRYMVHLSRLCIYHNPTTVIVMPFAFALFYFSSKEQTIKNFILVVFFFFANILIKQSFILAWAPAFLIYHSFFNFDNNKIKFKVNFKMLFCSLLFLLLIIALLLIIKSSVKTLQQGIIFSFSKALEIQMKGSGFTNIYLAHLFESFVGTSLVFDSLLLRKFIYLFLYLPSLIISAVFFPLCVLFISKTKPSNILIFSWLLFVFSYGISFFCIQESRPLDFNFSWQIPMVNSILFFSSLMFMLDFFKCSLSYILIFSSFLIHVYQGIVYLLLIIIKGYVL